MIGRTIKITGGLLLAAFILLPIWIWSYGFSPAATTGEFVYIYIPPGSSAREIQGILAAGGVIREDIRFQLLAGLTGKARHLKAGEYGFFRGEIPFLIIQDLARGKVVTRKITIPEGASLEQVSEILGGAEVTDPADFLGLARDAGFVRSLGIAAETMEGYLFPDTYYFKKNTAPEKILATMSANLARVLEDLCSLPQGHNPAGLHEVLTLAAIVEKEAAKEEERLLVATVFINRLLKNMRLQADPTILYGLGKRDGPISREDIKTPTRYNTYAFSGLPPGPIANPGKAAIAASLQAMAALPYEWPLPDCRPERFQGEQPGGLPLDYLYFVSNNDGTHSFSRNLEEHNQAVLRYRKKKQLAQ